METYAKATGGSRSNEFIGRVMDAATGLPLWLAHVVQYAADGSILAGAVTDNMGNFRLTPYVPGPITVSFVGYVPVTFTPAQDNPVIFLNPGVTLGEFEVVYTPDGPATVPTESVNTGEPPAPGPRKTWLWLLAALGVGVLASDS